MNSRRTDASARIIFEGGAFPALAQSANMRWQMFLFQLKTHRPILYPVA